MGLGIGGIGVANGMAAEPQAGAPELPWPYKKLDLDAAAERGYEGYYKGACCYAAFDGIVGGLRKEVGGPYNTFPAGMMVFGEGGVAGVSTLCGALNGAAMAIFLTAGGAEPEKKARAFALIRGALQLVRAGATARLQAKESPVPDRHLDLPLPALPRLRHQVVQGVEGQVLFEGARGAVRLDRGFRRAPYGANAQ